MRYQKPSIASALKSYQENGVDPITVFPLFPQYSSAAWGSAVEKLFLDAGQLWTVPTLQVVPPYYAHPAFIEALHRVSRPVLDDFSADRIVMSYHGLPERHILKSDQSQRFCLRGNSCCDEMISENRDCYRAQCFATSRALAQKLELSPNSWEVAFQSRLGRSPWIQPHTDVRIQELAEQGVRRLAVLCPSFTADCLETLEEIGMRARTDFLARGGEELLLVPCLNSGDAWANAIVTIAQETTQLTKSPESSSPCPSS